MVVGGGGSIGYRTVNNLKELGHDVSIVEIDKEKSSKLKEEGYITYSTKEEASFDNIDVVFICSPTSEHINDAIFFANKNKHIFVEKPLSYDNTNVSVLVDICKKNSLKLGCSCNLRYLSGIKLIKTLLESGNFGKIVSCDYYFGHWLPFWHNNNTWKESYSASENGGVLLDDSHSINLIEYLCGNIIESKGIRHHTGLLDIKKEDVTTHIHRTDKGVICRITSDYINHTYTRNMSVVCEKGNIQWEIESIEDGNIISSVYIHTPEIKEWRVFSCNQPLNLMYIDMLTDYISCVTNNKEFQCNGISELKIIDKIKKEDIFI